MFNFDFGKTLLRQIDAHKRLSPVQQQKREAALIHQVDTYAKKYMQVLANPGSANPGLLKNGAEALLEAALALKESRISYSTFADMVARSRKEQVVPQLAGLIDKLLELPTEMKPERISMLHWRLSAGALKPDKYLRYKSEHAQLTNDPADWKEYATRVATYLTKNELKPGDEVISAALEELVANKGRLGDRASATQLMFVESLIERRNARQAEALLIEMSSEHKDLPSNFLQVATLLVDSKPDASWELQQLVLREALQAYLNNDLPWNLLRERLDLSQQFTPHLVDYLLNIAEMPADEKLRRFVLQRISRLDPAAATKALARWQILLQKAAVELSIEEQELLTNVARGDLSSIQIEPEPEPELVATVEPLAEDSAPQDTQISEPELTELAPTEAAGDEEPAGEPAVDDALVSADAEEERIAAGLEMEAAEEPLAETETVLLEEAVEPNPEASLAEVSASTAEEPEPVAEPQPETAAPSADGAELEIAAASWQADQIDAAVEAAEEEASEALLEVESAEEAESAELMAAEAEPAAVEMDSLEAATEPQPVETGLPLDLRGMTEGEDLLIQLEIWAGDIAPAEGMLEELNKALDAANAPSWFDNEAILWLGERYLQAGSSDQALKAISLLRIDDSSVAASLLERLGALAERYAAVADFASYLGHLALVAEDYAQVIAHAQLLAEDHPAREELLQSVQERILSLSEPDAQKLMLLAQAARAALHDAQGGFEAATTASLMAVDDAEIQAQYDSWRSAVPENVLHQQRARQAAFLCAQHTSPELLGVTITELEALGDPIEGWSKPLEWLELIRPILDDLGAAQEENLRLRWTRLYLTHMAHSSERDRLPDALMSVSEKFEPAVALELVEKLAGAIPASARRVFQCDVLLRQGDWQRALDVALNEPGGESSALPIEQLCTVLPEEALLPASQRLTKALIERGDDAGNLLLVKSLGARCESSNGGSSTATELQDFIDQVLAGLCERQYGPAVRFRLEKGDNGDPEQTARDLLSVAQDNPEAWDRLELVFGKLCQAAATPELIKSIAVELAAQRPELAIQVLARAGLASGEVPWALGQIHSFKSSWNGEDNISLLIELASALKEPAAVLEVAQELSSSGAQDAALQLVKKLLASDPDSDLARIALIQLELCGGTRDLELAMGELLKLAQLYQERGIRPREALETLKPVVEIACQESSSEPEAQHLLLTLYALCGEMDHAAALVQQIMQRGPQAADGLLSLFERLAMQDTDLPSPLLIAWGRALFRAGRTTDALNRLAGLREAVVDYPEYIELLNEIKEGGGGPGASMQLGEAYLRVNLWQRSAEEYASALSADNSLAEPILTQLRHHAALDPIPMKYPLHLLGLRAVATSNRPMDWGWALSAMTWLTPRWSPEELYGLAKQLWGQLPRNELSEDQQVELLLHLFKLASKLSKSDEALEYLAQGWETLPTPTPELRNALKELDQSKLSDDSDLWLKLRRLELEHAIMQDDVGQAAAAAQELAKLSPEGREKALELLGGFKEHASDPMQVLLTRLKLLDLSSEEARDTFVRELLEAAGADLPSDQVHALIGTVLDMLRGSVDSPVLTRLLLQLFTQLGDLARAWQLALCHVLDKEGAAGPALEVVARIASDDFAVAQKLAMLEIQVLRQDYAAAEQVLDQLSWSNLGELSGLAADLAEGLIGTPLSAVARRWLIGHYRDTGQLEQAADMLVWAYAAGNPQPAEWLFDERSAALLFRAAQLHELQGNLDAAKRAYQRAHDAKCEDHYLAASICIRLMDLNEAAGQLEEARRLNAEALELIPDHAALKQKLSVLSRAINLQMIDEARRQGDSAERTLSVARLLRTNGDVNEAINELQAGIGRGQTNLEVFLDLAECFVESGEHTIGRRAYLEVLRRIERGEGDIELNLRVLYGLAQAEEDLGNPAEAIHRLEQLLLIRRDFKDGRQRMDRLAESLHQAPAKPRPGGSGQIVNDILSLLTEPDNPHPR